MTGAASARALVLLGVWLAAAYRTAVNSGMQVLWDAMRVSPVVQHDTFEPGLVVAVFVVCMGFFWVLDTHFTKALKPWRIQPSDDMRTWKLEGLGRVKGEVLWYIAPLTIIDQLYPRRTLPAAAPTAALLAAQVLGALLLYDLFFSWAHLACHRVPWLYRAVHAKHHSRHVQRAAESIRLSFWEEALDVMCSIAALNLLRCHPLSRCVYNICIVYLLTELHSGYDMPWMLQNVVPWGLWAGSRRHDAHHRTGRHYFQKFFTYLDDSLGLVPAWGVRHVGHEVRGQYLDDSD